MHFYALLSLVAVAMAYEAPPPLKNQIAGPILGIYAMCGNDPIDCGEGWCCLNGQQCVTDAKNNIMCYDPGLSEANDQPITVDPAYFGTMYSSQATPSHASNYASQSGSGSQSGPTTIVVAAPGASSAASAASAASASAAAAGHSATFAAPSSVQTVYGVGGPGNSGSTNGASNVSSNGALLSNDANTLPASYETGIVALVGAFMMVLAWL